MLTYADHILLHNTVIVGISDLSKSIRLYKIYKGSNQILLTIIYLVSIKKSCSHYKIHYINIKALFMR